MNWFKRHKIFAATAGVVLLLCLFVFASFLMGGGSTILGKTTETIITAIEKPFSAISGGIRSTFTGIFQYKTVLQENEDLKAQNQELQQQNLDLTLTKEELAQLKDLEKAFSFKAFAGHQTAIAGRIISLDNSNPFQTFIIDAGSAKGVKKNDIVVDGNGLVGRVRDVGKQWAKVASVLDENNNVSFKVLRRASAQGIVHGDGNGKLAGYLLNGDAKVVEGDILVTSGVGLYPEGVRIGKVTKVSFNKDLQLKEIEVSPTVQFTSLQKVAVFI